MLIKKGENALWIPLDRLRPGEHAAVVDVDGPSALVARLAEKGLRIGVAVEMIAPGQPCVVRLGETRLSFRLDQQVAIWVEVTESSHV